VKIHNDNPLDLSGKDGEVITVTIARSKAQVDLLLNGEVFEDESFKLDKTKSDPFLLAVGGVFTDRKKGEGAFSVSLSGNGITATRTATQFTPKEARRSFVFAIDIA
jgi:hypothetical protein